MVRVVSDTTRGDETSKKFTRLQEPASAVLYDKPVSTDLEANSEATDVTSNTKESATTLQDWDSPDDPGNPQNWSFDMKVYASAVPSLYAFAVTIGTSIFTPGVPEIMERFQVSRTVAILGLSLYSEGIAFGPMIGAPISENFGRKAVYTITLPVSILFTMATGLAQNIETVLVCRFFASAFGAPALAVGAGTVADVWELQHGGGLAAVLVLLTPFIGTALGPLVGGYTMETRGDWRWLMWVLILIAGPIWIMALFIGETSKAQILRRRARQRNLLPPPKLPLRAAVKALFVVTLFRPIRMLLTEPIVGFISLYVSFTFGILFAFFDAFPYVFQGIYGFSVGHVGLAFLGIIIGVCLAVVTFAIVDKTLYAAAKTRVLPGKMPPPEERLYTSMFGSVGIPISLFWFAWTARPTVHWIVPILAGIPFGWGNLCLFLGTMTYIVDTYQASNAASAVAANGLGRYSFGAAFPLFTLQMYSRLGIAWAGSLLGFIGILLLPIPWVLYRWGPYLRSRSAFETEDF